MRHRHLVSQCRGFCADGPTEQTRSSHRQCIGIKCAECLPGHGITLGSFSVIYGGMFGVCYLPPIRRFPRNYSPPIIPAGGLNQVVFAWGIRGSQGGPVGFSMLNFLERRVLKALVYKKHGFCRITSKLGCKEGGKDTYPGN